MASLLSTAGFSGSNGSKFQLNLYYEILEQNVAGNYSYVRYSLYWKSLGYSGSGSTVRGYINGVEVGTATKISANENKYMGSRDEIIYHDSAGNGYASFSANINTPWTLGSASTSGSYSLPYIPRASSVSCSSANIGETATISINQASDAFTHTLSYAFGNLSGTIATGVKYSCGFTLPTSFYSQIPNAKTGIGVIFCETYYNGIKVGDTQSCSLNAYTNENTCKPSVSATIVDTNTKSIELTGDSNKLIKYVSNAQITINATAKNSASISSKSVRCGDGKSATGNTTFNGVESGNFTVSTSDSRGYSNSINYTLDIVPYIKLTLNPEFYRVEPTTGEVSLIYSGNYFNGNFGTTNNSLELKYRYKEHSSSNWSSYKNLTPIINNDGTYSGTANITGTFDYQKKYDFEIVASDKIDSKIVSQTLTQGIPSIGMFEKMIEVFGEKVFWID